jgi:hypothetical protein
LDEKHTQTSNVVQHWRAYKNVDKHQISAVLPCWKVCFVIEATSVKYEIMHKALTC